MTKTAHGASVTGLPNVLDEERAAPLTRRTVLTGAAASTAIATFTPALAQGADPQQDMPAFVTLSAALTGVAAAKLVPFADTLEINQDYFRWINARQPAAFVSLLQIVKAAGALAPDNDGRIKQDDVDRLVTQIEAHEDTKFLARSIVLMWYLGSWFEPADLKALTGPNPPRFIGHTVISPKAYTQGWLWRVIQAHPMGYSELQFGYWHRQPLLPPTEYITTRKPRP
jgi:hypothetical protein